MGHIDSVTYDFACPKCKVTEQAKINEYGSAYSSSWASPPDLTHFSVDWSEQLRTPRPANATCKRCGPGVTVNIS